MAGRCTLNNHDCSLGLQLHNGGVTAVPSSRGAFGFAWSGGRTTIGVCGGRHRFGLTVLQVSNTIESPCLRHERMYMLVARHCPSETAT